MMPDVALPAPQQVVAGVWTIAPSESTARFRVRDKLVGTASGTIPVRSGTVVLDAEGCVESARMELDVTGIDSGNAHRDRDLRRPHFLAAATHPIILVQAGSAVAGADGWELTADLTARGAIVPVTLTVRLVDLDERTARVRITGHLDRTGLGMRVPTFIVGRTVDIEVEALFRL